MKVIDIIGAPIGIGASERGSSLGPDAIRFAGLRETLFSADIKHLDLGNQVFVDQTFLPKPNESGNPTVYLEEVYDFMVILKQRVAESLRKGRFPLVLGGDHSLAIGSLSAVANYYKNKSLKSGLIWFDAHIDFGIESAHSYKYIHGMPLAISTGQGNEKLLSLFEGNFIDPTRTIAMGIRNLELYEKKILKEIGLQVFTMEDIEELGMAECTRRAIKIASPDGNPIHLSFDIDGLDPKVVSGTGTTLLGGVTLREAHLMLKMLSNTGLIRSMDMAEVNPILDTKNETASVAVDLIRSAFEVMVD